MTTITALDPRRVITRVIPDDDRLIPIPIPTTTDDLGAGYWLRQAAATADPTWADVYMALAHQA